MRHFFHNSMIFVRYVFFSSLITITYQQSAFALVQSQTTVPQVTEYRYKVLDRIGVHEIGTRRVLAAQYTIEYEGYLQLYLRVLVPRSDDTWTSYLEKYHVDGSSVTRMQTVEMSDYVELYPHEKDPIKGMALVDNKVIVLVGYKDSKGDMQQKLVAYSSNSLTKLTETSPLKWHGMALAPNPDRNSNYPLVMSDFDGNGIRLMRLDGQQQEIPSTVFISRGEGEPETKAGKFSAIQIVPEGDNKYKAYGQVWQSDMVLAWEWSKDNQAQHYRATEFVNFASFHIEDLYQYQTPIVKADGFLGTLSYDANGHNFWITDERFMSLHKISINPLSEK
ncbi:hypothetical protein [Serratia fonticola]|uniref:hypothetical protein n=1 Tax=Serratia fonticola TaxID=47917 RepID=UPI0024DE077F|nr:hypothetical protein [Serratia fonticola]MDK2373859.1 hypothetical protein [Serratia fonticola]